MIDLKWAVLAVVAVLVLAVAAWLLSRATRKPPRREYRPDVLDEGVGPAQRNQALIDAESAASRAAAFVPPAAELIGGIGEVIAAAAQDEVLHAGDDLTRIKGLGPKLKATLNGLGVTSFAQIAAWGDEDIARIDVQLGSFAGRPQRDNWVEQAKFLAAGDTTGFEGRFGKL